MAIYLDHIEQGTEAWFQARLGRITMSNAGKLLAGGQGKTRNSYIISVASELITGIAADKISTWDMERGILLEPYARQAYESMTRREVRQTGLAYLNEERRISASPDGVMAYRGVEIKCPSPKNHLATIIEGKSPRKHAPQLQGSMWVTDLALWDYCSFCPEFKEMPLFIVTAYRDEEMIKRIEESALRAVEEVDDYVKMAKGNTSQEIREICNAAKEMIDIMQNKEPEIY